MTTTLPDPHQQPADAGVRRAGVADASAVGRVQALVWAQAFADDLPPQALELCTPEGFAAAWRAGLSDPPSPDHVLLLAHEGDHVVGLAALGPSPDPDSPGASEILVLGVEPEARRRGHGSRLLAAVADLTRDGELLVWVVARHDGTRAFLQGAGFAPDGARRERVVDPDGGTVMEARLVTALSDVRPSPPAPAHEDAAAEGAAAEGAAAEDAAAPDYRSTWRADR